MAEAYDFTVFTSKPLDEVIGALNATLTKYGVQARWSADVSSGLRDLDADPGREIVIMEACEAEGAAGALGEEARLAYFIPTRLVVFEGDEGTFCGFLRPTELCKALDRPDLQPYADRLEKLLRLAVVEATELEEAGPRAGEAGRARAADGPGDPGGRGGRGRPDGEVAEASRERREERPIH